MSVRSVWLAALAWLFSAPSVAAPAVSISFVLDESGSIDSSEFQLETDGFLSALARLPADGSLEISVVGFASSSTVVLESTVLTASSYSDIESALADNPKSGGGTNIGPAIDAAFSELSASAAESKVICLATDGISSDSTAATAAADAAKAAGIILVPVGIALNSSGVTFLDSIASNPPVANPANFEEFGTVVTNVCAGVAEANAGLRLMPESVSFGSITVAEVATTSLTRELLLENRSSRPITVVAAQIAGVDENSFVVDSIKGVPFSEFIEFSLEPRESVPLEVTFAPNLSPADGIFDAQLEITGSSESGDVRAEAPLLAEVGPVSLGVDIIDASSNGWLIRSFDESTGSPVGLLGEVSEVTIHDFSDVDEYRRTGYVADGVARLLVRARTNLRQDVTISVPSTFTAATVHRLNVNLTDLSPLEDNVVTIPADDLYMTDSGDFQGTAVLLAEERFPADANVPEVSYDLTVSVADPDGGNASSVVEPITVRRTPVVLIHGLWASEHSWIGASEPNGPPSNDSMWSNLDIGHFRFAAFNYDSDLGPSDTMRSDNDALGQLIYEQCREENSEGFACARNDVVGHSMGGLVARKFVYDNELYENFSNFDVGAIRRLVTLGTPHFGSELADLLELPTEAACVTDTAQLQRVRRLLWIFNSNPYRSAIADLTTNSDLLADLNDASASSRTPQQVAAFGIIGDTGTQLLMPFITEGLRLITATGCDHASLFGNQNSDGVVPVNSARGNLSVESTLTLPNVGHTGMGTNQEVVTETINLLNGLDIDFSPTVKNSSEPIESPLLLLADSDSSSLGQLWGSAVRALGQAASPRVAHAQTLPSVQIAASDVAPAPGSTVTVTLEVDGQVLEEAWLTDGQGYIAEVDQATLSWDITFGANAAGLGTYWAGAIVDGEVVRSNDISIRVLPNLANLQQLEFLPARPSLMFPGSTEQQHIFGMFFDGLKRDLKHPEMETTYSERIVDGLATIDGDSPVIDISSDGVITALQPGVAIAVATNNGTTTTRRITVEAVYPDDSDGDGLTDEQEQLAGTNIYDSDSDDDGVLDDDEIGSDPGSPLDSNDDGQIDALDNSALAIVDQTGSRVTIRTSSGQIRRASGRSLDEFPGRSGDLASINMENGMFAFEVGGLSVGERIEVSFDFEGSLGGVNRWLKYGLQQPTNTTTGWYSFDDFEVSGNRVTLTLTDNQLGDASPLEGVITDPGGPGVFTAPSIPDNEPPRRRGGGASSVSEIGVLAFLFAWIVLRQSYRQMELARGRIRRTRHGSD